MQTEFTCGIYTAINGNNEWSMKCNTHDIAIISKDGLLINFIIFPHLTQDMLIEIAVLMNNIKRQYKQLANESSQ